MPSRRVGVVSAASLGTASRRGGTMTAASGWRAATAPYTSSRSWAPSPVNEASGSAQYTSLRNRRSRVSSSSQAAALSSVMPPWSTAIRRSAASTSLAMPVASPQR